MRLHSWLLLLLLAVMTAATASELVSRNVLAQAGYRTYHNARFDYSISYPAGVLIPQGEAENGDGQKFQSKDGRVEMLVYGSNNALDQTLRQMYQQEHSVTEHPNRRVTYQVLRADWFVVSGVDGDRVFYQKTFLRHGVFKTFRIEYDQSQKAAFDSITGTISRSFKG